MLALLLALPVLAVLGAWLPLGQGDAQSGAILREMAATVLPDYLWTTLWLSLAVAIGAALVGTASAAAVTLFDFAGRRQLEWLLLLPLAMPAYVTAYAYTDFLQFSGPLQVWLREAFGLQGRAGILVAGIYRGSPAQQANLLPGDIILSIDGEAASNGRRSMNQVARTQPGQRIQIEILRDGKLLQLSAEVGVRPTAGEQ